MSHTLALVERERRKRRLDRNQQLIDRAYPLGGINEYYAAIRAAGNPQDQIERLEKAGVILQPKQLSFAAQARLADIDNMPDEIGFGGARGGGKSYALFVQAVIDDCQRFPDLKVLYLRKAANKAEEQMLDLIKSTLRFVPHVYVSKQIRFPNGSKVLIGHFQNEKEALSYLGIEYDIIIIEETTTLSAGAYEAIRLSCRSSKGFRPRVYNSTNPMGIGHNWYKKRFIDPFRRKLKVNQTFIDATIDDNRFVNKEYTGQLDELTGNKYRAYRKGDWDVAAGAYFTNWDYLTHVKPRFNQIPDGWTVWASMDFGFNHWNVIHLHAESHDGIGYTFHELAHRFRHPEEIAVDIKNMLGGYNLTRHDLELFVVGGDAFNKTGAAKETVAQQYSKLDLPMSRADNSPGSRIMSSQYISKRLGNVEREHGDGTITYIHPTWFITDNCPRLIESIPEILVDPNNPEAPLKMNISEDGSGGDDFFDCARMGIYKPKASSMH